MSNKAALQNKRYDECYKCKKLIILDKKIVDKDGKVLPLTLGRKRHHCSGTELILAEEHIVKEIEMKIDWTNRIELSSFQLELVIKERTS